MTGQQPAHGTREGDQLVARFHPLPAAILTGLVFLCLAVAGAVSPMGLRGLLAGLVGGGMLSALLFGMIYLAAGRDRVWLAEDALVVKRRSHVDRWPWDDVARLSWDNRLLSGGLLLQTRSGGRWDCPGPNQPALVASVLLDLRARGRAPHRLRQAAEAHGIPWDAAALSESGPVTRGQGH